MAKNWRIETLFDNDKEKSYDIWKTVSEKLNMKKNILNVRITIIKNLQSWLKI